MTYNPLGADINILDNNLTQIFRDSEEWLTLEYFLQMNARTSRVKLVQAWNISPVEVVNKFKKRNFEKLVLKSFIDTSSMDMNNTIQDVCVRGFSISKKGLKLSIGNFNIPGFPLISLNKDNPHSNTYELTYEQNESNEGKKSLKKRIMEQSENILLSGERGIFEFFVCDVGVGLSLSVNEDEVNSYDRDILPMEYDSIFIKKKGKNSSNNYGNSEKNGGANLVDSLTIHYKNKENNNNEKEINLALGGDVMPSYGVLPYYTFNHEYVIYDSSQLLPRYLIQFECDPSAEEVFSIPLCDYCGNAPSLYYCESDEVKLCEKCDNIIHSQNKLVKKHIRKTLNEAQSNFGNCKIHLQNEVNMFCTVCHVPICNLCMCSHAHKDLSNVNLFNFNNNSDTIISLKMAYNAIMQHSSKPSNFIKERKKNLNNLLEKIDKLHEQVSLNMNEAEKNVYTVLEDLVKQLHTTTDKKMSSILSEEYELKRQFNEIMWNENFLYYLQTILPPADFMNAWLKHCQYREEIEQNSEHSEKINSLIFPDIRIKGNINVITEGSINHKNIFHSSDHL
ncbi:zinc finger protein, putative [Plasmodium vinckei]|uniref:Zinc finger protein, putative n=1 Tax=Plasmodium vinckei TaxID=5860 RepID=A0A6V7TA04_PLAVN|nr:zinc finger protein, putative [Plasmodium vinckei]